MAPFFSMEPVIGEAKSGTFAANWRIAVALSVGVLVLFLLFPYPGSRNWDGSRSTVSTVWSRARG